MFEQTAAPRPTALPRWVSVLSTAIGSFGLGIWTGKRLLGSKPFDWFLDIFTVLFMAFWTLGSAIKAAKNGQMAKGE
jgi:hypothetical protein